VSEAGSPVPVATRPTGRNRWSLSVRLLRYRKGPALAFAILYGLGLAVFLMVDALCRLVETDLQGRGRELLEADIQIESRRPLDAGESSAIAGILPPGGRQAQAWGFLSMVAGKSGASRLVQIKAVDGAYPLFGAFSFAGPMVLSEWRPGAVLAPPALLASLDLRVGDSLSIGEKRFLIQAAYTDRPGGGFDFWEMSGRIYMHLQDVAATGLDQKGSRIFRYRFFEWPATQAMAEAGRLLREKLSDPEIEVHTVGDGDSDMGRLLANVGGFLKILALGAYLLAAVGAAFFFSRHLEAERPRAALLRTLGATPGSVLGIYLRQNLLLSAVSSLLGITLSLAAIALFLPLTQSLLGMQVAFGFPWMTLASGLLLPPVTAVLFALGGLWQMGQAPPVSLLRRAQPPALPWAPLLLLFSAQALAILLLARWVSHSWILGLSSLAGIGACLGLLWLLGNAVLELGWKWRSVLGYADKVLLGTVRLRRTRSLTAFFALGFTAFAIALLPLLRQSLRDELSAPQGQSLPSLFLFDIQEEEESEVQSLLRAMEHPLQSSAPMVRARLLRVNGQDFKRDESRAGEATLEAGSRARMRNRGFNLSWRAALEPSESVIAGEFWPRDATVRENTLPEISVEKGFADKLGLRLRDTLAFDVQGVEIAGRITSLRRVRWNSFRPNFFVLFQPGVLEDAPKVYLGTVAGDVADPARIRDSLVKKFPNVSVLDVAEAIKKVDGMMGRLQRLVDILSLGYFIIGMAILVTVVEGSVRDGRRSLLLMRVLGAGDRKLYWATTRHYLAFGLLATVAGLSLAALSAYAVHAWIWHFAFRPPWAFLTLGAACGLGVGAVAASWAVLRSRGDSLRALLAGSRGE